MNVFSHSRFNTFSKNSFICIGGSGIDPTTTEADVENVIQTTLEQVARDGFDEARIDGLMNEMELMYKQIKRSTNHSFSSSSQ